MNDKYSIDIIVPCYNPNPGFTHIVVDAINKLHSTCPDHILKLILVNDGSTNDIEAEINTLKEALGENLLYLQYPLNMGKGHAIRHGVMHSNSGYIVYTDIDFPYTSENIVEIISELASGADVVVGVRTNEYYKNLPFFRIPISMLARFALKYILRIKIPDTQCGLKGFSKKAKPIFLQTKINRFLFDMEFILKAGQNPEIKMIPHPVILREGVEFSHFNFRILFREFVNFIKIYYFK